MHEMIEKVAQSIRSTWRGGSTPWDELHWQDKSAYIAEARAAITAVFDALQEPSHGMLAKGLWQVSNEHSSTKVASNVWDAMLAQARREALGPTLPPKS